MKQHMRVKFARPSRVRTLCDHGDNVGGANANCEGTKSELGRLGAHGSELAITGARAALNLGKKMCVDGEPTGVVTKGKVERVWISASHLFRRGVLENVWGEAK